MERDTRRASAPAGSASAAHLAGDLALKSGMGLGPASSGSKLRDTFEQLSREVRAHDPAGSPKLLEALRRVRHELDAGGDGRALQRQVSSLARQIAADPQLLRALGAPLATLRDDVVQTLAARQGLTISLRHAGPHLFDIALVAPEVGRLSPQQRAALHELRVFAAEVNLALATPEQTSTYSLALQSFLESLAKRLILGHALRGDLRTPEPPAQPGLVDPEEVRVFQGLHETIDAMLRSPRPVRADLFQRLRDVVEAVSDSPPGGAADATAEALQVPAELRAAPLASADSTPAPDAAQAQSSGRARRQTGSGLSLRNPPSIPSILRERPRAERLPPSDTASAAPLDAADDVNRALWRVLRGLPQGTGEDSHRVLATYAEGVEALQQALTWIPPFGLVMPVPYTYESGGTTFVLAKGTRLVHEDGELVAHAPGMILRSEGALVESSDAIITLGDASDSAALGSMRVATDSRDMLLEGALIETGRADGLMILRADSARVSLEDGEVALQNTRFVQASPSEWQLASDALLWQYGDERARTGELSIGEQVSGDRSRLAAEARDLDIDANHFDLTARRMSLIADTSTSDPRYGELRWLASGLTFDDGSTRLSAERAELGFTGNADGTSAIHLAGQTLAVDLDGKSLATQGDARIQIDMDASGEARSLLARADQLELRQGAERAQVRGGSLQVALGDDDAMALTARGAHLEIDTAKGSMRGAGVALDLGYEQGVLRKVAGSANSLAWRDPAGLRLDVRGLGTELVFDDTGLLSQATAGAQGLTLEPKDGERLTVENGQARLAYDARGLLSSATIQAGRVTHGDGAQRLDLSDAALSLVYGDGDAARLQASLGTGSYEGRFGSLELSGGSQLGVDYDERGNLRNLEAAVAALRYGGDHGSLRLDGSRVEGLVAEDGTISRLQLGAEGARFETPPGKTPATVIDTANAQLTVEEREGGGSMAKLSAGTIDAQLVGRAIEGARAESLSVAISSGADGTLEAVAIAAAELSASRGAEQLHVRGGAISAVAEGGALSSLRVDADRVDYRGEGEHGHPTQIGFDDAAVQLKQAADGATRLSFAGTRGVLELSGHRVAIDRVRELSAETNADGAITSIVADFPGRIAFEKTADGIDVQLVDLQGRYDAGASRMTASFGEADVKLAGEGVSAIVRGGAAIDIDRYQARMYVADATFLRELESGLPDGLTLKDFQLIVRTTEGGALRGVELTAQNIAAHTQGMELRAVSPDGEQLRFEAEMDEDGRALRRVYLETAEGGELLIATDDVSARLAGAHELTRDAATGTLTFTGRDTELDARWKDLRLDVDSDSMRVALDAERGLIFNHVSGTHIDVKAKDWDAHIDVRKLDDLLFKLTKMEGLAKGASLVLEPTSDGSRVSMSVTASAGGVPVRLELDDLRGLDAAALVAPNVAHFHIKDTAGKGKIELGVGSFEISGEGEVGATLRYNPFDADRMSMQLGRLLERDCGIGGKFFCLEADGMATVGLLNPAVSPVHASMTVLLPRTNVSATGFSLGMGPKSVDGAPGVLFRLGAQSVDEVGRRSELSAHAGVLPGSFASVEFQGDARLGGVALPNAIGVPTTAVAGVEYHREWKEGGKRLHELDLQLNAYANPVSAASTPYLREDHEYGVQAGLMYKTPDLQLGAEASYDVRDGRDDYRVMFRVGIPLGK